MKADFEDGCQISINLESREKTSSGNPGWPSSVDECENQALLANQEEEEKDPKDEDQALLEKQYCYKDPTPEPCKKDGLGGYAVLHPDGYVAGVIVSTSVDPFGNGGVMPHEYMGAPAGSKLLLQTTLSDTGNVFGWHGKDVKYNSKGVITLSDGTTIFQGIATSPDGRVWETGTGKDID